MSNITNAPKLIIIGGYIAFCGIALLIGRITFVEFGAVTGPFVGYLVGNGIAAKNGDPVQPAIGRATVNDA